MKKNLWKLISLVSAVLLLIAALPMSATAASAAPAKMLDNVYLDALSYTGYKVQSQINDGTIYVKYARNIPSSVLSGIGYGTGPSGLETVSGNTQTGKTPDIAKFKSQGLCCASYVSYVYYNYLPNIARIDTSSMGRPANPRLAASYHEAANGWVSSGKARRISFTQSGSTFTPSEDIPIGSLMVFKNPSDGRIAHVAIYAGAYDGKHFVTHVSDEQGPEIGTVEWLIKGNEAESVVQIVVPEFVESNGTIEVYKKDPNGKNLSGAVFVATNTASGTQYPIGPTDKNGYAVTKEGLPYGTYTVKETVFPQGYTASGQTQWTVNLNSAQQTVTINAVNTLQQGKITLEKTGEVFASVKEENGVFIPIFEEKGLSGAKFDLIAEDHSVVDTLITDQNGKAESRELPLGNYKLQEIKAPFGFLLDSAPKTVELSYAGQAVQTTIRTVSIVNIRQKANIELLKAMELDSHYSVGSNDEIKNVTFGLFAEEDLTALDGKTIPKDGLLEIASPNEKGEIAFTADLPVGAKVYVKEQSTDEHYVLSESVYPLELSFESQGEPTVQITVNDGEAIVNRMKRGRIEIRKTDENGEPLAGAIFGLFSPDDGEQTENSALQTLFSDENGLCVFEEIPYGHWTVKELYGVEGYVKDDSLHEVTVTEDGESVSLTVINKKIFGSVTVQKTDKATGKALSGAVFTVTDEGGNEFAKGETNEKGVLTFSDLPYGSYTLRETKSPAGYAAQQEAISFQISEDVQSLTFTVPNEEESTPLSPKTGDNGKPLPALATLLISLAGLLLAYKKLSNGRKKEV